MKFCVAICLAPRFFPTSPPCAIPPLSLANVVSDRIFAAGQVAQIHLCGNESGLARRIRRAKCSLPPPKGASALNASFVDADKMPKRDISIGKGIFVANYSIVGSSGGNLYGRPPREFDGFATDVRHWRCLAINSCLWWWRHVQPGSKWDCRKVRRAHFREPAGSDAKRTISKSERAIGFEEGRRRER